MGASGVGDIYRARDTRVGRTVTVTILRHALTSEAALRDQVLGAARAAAVVSHPNIAATYEVGEDQGVVFGILQAAPTATIDQTSIYAT